MRFQDLNWMDVERYLQTDTRIMLITGATEQHAYLSLMTDILIPERIALAAAEQESVLVAPPFNFGASGYFAEFPGTISLSPLTFEQVLLEVVTSLLHHGFERFFILNGHGGNTFPQRLQDLHTEGSARILWYDWWREHAATQFAAKLRLAGDHANWIENFPFNRVAEIPSGEKPPVNLALIDEGLSAREVLGDGSFGGPYSIDDALMQALFAQVVAEVVERLRNLREL